MIMTNFSQTQRFFYKLLSHGAVSKARVTTSDEAGIKILTATGFTGVLEASFSFNPGREVEVFFDRIEEETPIFKLTEGWLRTNLPQVATVCVVTEQGIGLLFEEVSDADPAKKQSVPGFFAPQGGVPAELQSLKIGDKVEVMVSALENEGYIVSSVKRMLVQPVAPVALTKWDDEKVEAEFRAGHSRKVLGSIRLGQIYTADIRGINLVTLPGNVEGHIVSDRKPLSSAKTVIVRIVRITADRRIEVEYCRTQKDEAPLPAHVDPEKFDAAIAKGSARRCGGYFPGGTYKQRIVNGRPEFSNINPDYAEINRDIKQINVSVVKSPINFHNGQYYWCEVVYINDLGSGEYTIEAKVIGKA